jgi:sugar/nucleoside kinase (ribokinase family)
VSRSRFDVVGVGANSIDHVYRVPGWPQPEGPAAKLRVTDHQLSCGGQTATTLSTCAAMGLRATYIGAFGCDPHGRRMRQELGERQVDLTYAITREAPNAYAVILIDDLRGERMVLWDRDARLELRPEEIEADVIAGARILHVDDADETAAIRAARIALDAGVPATSDIERVSNQSEELIAMVSTPIFAEHVPSALTGEPDVERALRRLRRPHHRMLCVTLGARGALLLEGDRSYVEPGFKVDVVDTTAAGDVFRGAFIYGLLQGCGAQAIVEFANAAAAVSCTRAGAINSVPTIDETLRLIATKRPTPL